MNAFCAPSWRRWIALMIACWASLVLPGVAQVTKAKGPFPYTRLGVANGCFVESVAFGDAVRDRLGEGAWYRLLQWGAKDADEVVAGHAVLVFDYRGQLWSYDINHAFTALTTPAAQREDVAAVAKQATQPYIGKITPRYPIYREDFPQTPDTNPPAAPSEVVDNDLRDAAVLAARLAKFRPVTLVEFSYPKENETKAGAAVAFVYNGRLCVYSPAYGTVPFRVKAISVDNTRQLQELVRRIHPGATNLKFR